MTGDVESQHPLFTGLFADAFANLRRHWRALYGFHLAVTAATTLVGTAVLAAGFGMASGAFADARADAEAAIAAEDSYVAYADQWDTLEGVGIVVTLLLLLLTALVLAVTHAAHAVAVSHPPHDDARLSTAALWRRTRPHLDTAFRVQLGTGLRAGSTVLAGLALAIVVDLGAVPGAEPERLGGTGNAWYMAVGWWLPIAISVSGLVVFFRLCAATAAAVNEGCRPWAALDRSWALTRRARWRTTGIGLLLTAAVTTAFLLLRYAAAPVAHPVGLAMLRLSGGNPYPTGVLMLITPSAVALLLLPLVVLPPVCSVPAVLHARLAGTCT